MSDLKKAANEMSAKAALSAAKDAASAAKNAIGDALSTEEERAQRKAERAALAKKRRTKWIVLGVIALLLVLGMIGLAVHYWHWFLLAGLVALAALYGRYRWRRSRKAHTKAASPRAQEVRVTIEQREEPAAIQQPSVEPDSSIEDELAALKARVKKQG